MLLACCEQPHLGARRKRGRKAAEGERRRVWPFVEIDEEGEIRYTQAYKLILDTGKIPLCPEIKEP